jgi:hypothetical protein
VTWEKLSIPGGRGMGMAYGGSSACPSRAVKDRRGSQLVNVVHRACAPASLRGPGLVFDRFRFRSRFRLRARLRYHRSVRRLQRAWIAVALGAALAPLDAAADPVTPPASAPCTRGPWT